MRKILILSAGVLALAGCTTSSEPGIEVRTVPVPTPVPCVNEDDLPGQTPESELTGNAIVDSGLLKAETLDLRAENGDLRALIVPGCTTVSD